MAYLHPILCRPDVDEVTRFHPHPLIIALEPERRCAFQHDHILVLLLVLISSLRMMPDHGTNVFDAKVDGRYRIS